MARKPAAGSGRKAAPRGQAGRGATRKCCEGQGTTPPPRRVSPRASGQKEAAGGGPPSGSALAEKVGGVGGCSTSPCNKDGRGKKKGAGPASRDPEKRDNRQEKVGVAAALSEPPAPQSNIVDNAALLQGISQTLAQISQCMEQLGASPPQEGGASLPGKGICRRPAQDDMGPSSESEEEEPEGCQVTRGKRGAKWRKSRRASYTKGSSESSSSSGESSDEDSVHKNGSYWKVGAKIPGLPSWISKRREADAPSAGRIWGGDRGTSGRSRHQLEDYEDPPGLHLSRKVRERILNGYFIDLFALLKPQPGETGTKRDKKGEVKGRAERTFQNWLEGYTVYMTLVGAAFPERAWHLMNHLSNVLKAKTLAGEGPAIAYDEAFRRRASHNALTRWDLCNNYIWLDTVELHARAQGKKEKQGFKTEFTRRVCWDFNQARCHRARCKYEHICEACFGHHAKVACNKVNGIQLPFPVTCPSGSGAGRKEGGPSNAEPTATTSKRA